MEDRPKRKRLVSAWSVGAAGATVLVLALAGGLAFVTYASSLVTVPDLIGRPSEVAVESAGLAGLEVSVVSRRFSGSVAEDSVLEQDPAAGARVKRGAVVSVVVSAGTEAVLLPDLIGLSLKEASSRLAALGLGLTTVDVASAAPAGTVVESFPGPGVEVTTGESVRLSVAVGGPVGDSLLPYELQGLHVVIDAAPSPSDTADVPLEIAWRVQSLLEASGADVTMTRSTTASAPPVAERGSVVASASGDVCIGLDVGLVDSAGLTPVVVDVADTASVTLAETMAGRFMTLVRSENRPVNSWRTSTDEVIGKIVAPGLRVVLGSADSPEDAARFSDPEWADAVARALYRAIGETFGPE